MFAFAGPAYLVSVGYMDPGNWATDLEGGARFGYRLLWVLVMSNAMAILLQTLSARLGIVSGRDLAQACRETYPRPVTWRCGCCAKSPSRPATWPKCWARPSRSTCCSTFRC
jgi:manganese transport protein